jgi:hypothetical protein
MNFILIKQNQSFFFIDTYKIIIFVTLRILAAGLITQRLYRFSVIIFIIRRFVIWMVKVRLIVRLFKHLNFIQEISRLISLLFLLVNIRPFPFRYSFVFLILIIFQYFIKVLQTLEIKRVFFIWLDLLKGFLADCLE